MLRDMLNINSCLVNLENTLKIDYSATSMKEIVSKSISSLEMSYKCRLDKDLYSIQVESTFLSENINVLLNQIIESLKSFSLLFSITMFDKKRGMTLDKVNYLGFSKEALLTALKFLQDEDLYEKREEFLDTLFRAASMLETSSTIRRLFCIMAVLEKLGVKEGVSLISQYLYFGGVV